MKVKYQKSSELDISECEPCCHYYHCHSPSWVLIGAHWTRHIEHEEGEHSEGDSELEDTENKRALAKLNLLSTWTETIPYTFLMNPILTAWSVKDSMMAS